MPVPGRSKLDNDYRYGFNGMETDPEAKGAWGNQNTTFFRQYDARLGRWFSTDPVTQPHQSPYNGFDGNPIYYADPKGDWVKGAGFFRNVFKSDERIHAEDRVAETKGNLIKENDGWTVTYQTKGEDFGNGATTLPVSNVEHFQSVKAKVNRFGKKHAIKPIQNYYTDEVDDQGLIRSTRGPISDATAGILNGTPIGVLDNTIATFLNDESTKADKVNSSVQLGVVLLLTQRGGGKAPKVSSPLSKNAKLLRTGGKNTTVNVKTKADADALLKESFPDYQKVNGVGPQDASGIRKKTKMDRFKQGGAYHKDYSINHSTGTVRGHGVNDPHGQYPHINIKRTDGVKVIINITGQ